MQQSICFQSATQGLIFFWGWQTGGGSSNKRKNNLELGSWGPGISNSTTLIYASFHTVSSISNSAYSMLLEMKADNDPVGGPVKPLKLRKCEKETDVKGNISQTFIVYENDALLGPLECFLWGRCRHWAVTRCSTICRTVSNSFSRCAFARKLRRERLKRGLWICCTHASDSVRITPLLVLLALLFPLKKPLSRHAVLTVAVRGERLL